MPWDYTWDSVLCGWPFWLAVDGIWASSMICEFEFGWPSIPILAKALKRKTGVFEVLRMLTELAIVIVECRDASCDVIRMQMNPCKKLLRQWLVMMTYFYLFYHCYCFDRYHRHCHQCFCIYKCSNTMQYNLYSMSGQNINIGSVQQCMKEGPSDSLPLPYYQANTRFSFPQWCGCHPVLWCFISVSVLC